MERIKGFMGLNGYILHAGTFHAVAYGIDRIGSPCPTAHGSSVRRNVWGEVACGLPGGNPEFANDNEGRVEIRAG